MNDQSEREEGKEPCPGLVFGKTTVIVNRRTAVLVARARDQGWFPAQTDNCPRYEIWGILPIWPMAGKGILKARMKADL